MIEFSIKLISIITSTLIATNTHDQNLQYLFWGLSIPLVIDCLRLSSEYLIKNFSILKTTVISQTIRYNTKIRISCSYLYRIKVEDRYLLVKNSHRYSYQLVGGVYKQNDFSKGFLSSIGYTNDEHLPTSDKCTDDFRFCIKGTYLNKFINWYTQSKDRELSCDREFYEELISPGILSNENFPYPRYDFKKQIITPIIWSKFFNCWELLIYDILDIKLNENQLKELTSLKRKGDSDQVKWVTLEVIKCLGHDHTSREGLFPIGEHTKWAIMERFTKR